MLCISLSLASQMLRLSRMCFQLRLHVDLIFNPVVACQLVPPISQAFVNCIRIQIRASATVYINLLPSVVDLGILGEAALSAHVSLG